MRKTIEENLNSMARTAAAKANAAVKEVREKGALNALKQSQDAMTATGVLALSAAATVFMPVVNAIACTNKEGCETDPTATFLTVATLGAMTALATKRIHGKFFVGPVKPIAAEQTAALTTEPVSPTNK